MSSNSAQKFSARVTELAHLRAVALDRRIKPITDHQKQIYLHSYLTGIVAAWDSYIKSLIQEFLTLTTNPADLRYTTIFDLLRNYASNSIDKLNTPNAENVRKILSETTGYDPIGDWIWTARGFNGLATRERLNEILKVRHSFAHGFSMPSYQWNRTATGKVRLTVLAVDDAKALLVFFVWKCDRGLSQTLRTFHGINSNW